MPINRSLNSIYALERRIAKELMLWDISSDPAPRFKPWWTDASGQRKHDMQWSPWFNTADALEVLERLANLYPPKLVDGIPRYTIHAYPKRFLVIIPCKGTWVEAFSEHYGPAVCLLAEKILTSRFYEVL